MAALGILPRGVMTSKRRQPACAAAALLGSGVCFSRAEVFARDFRRKWFPIDELPSCLLQGI